MNHTSHNQIPDSGNTTSNILNQSSRESIAGGILGRKAKGIKKNINDQDRERRRLHMMNLNKQRADKKKASHNH